MEIQEEKVMWIRKIGLGILVGVVLCSVMVNAEERNSRKAEPMTVMERMREIPHKIYSGLDVESYCITKGLKLKADMDTQFSMKKPFC